MYQTDWDLWCMKGTFEVGDEATPVVLEGDIIADVEKVAERVHKAWMAEKQRQGFADHVWPGHTDFVLGTVYPPSRAELHEGCRFSKERHHADMVPFNQLSDATKEYDRATVRAVLAALVEEDNP